MSPGQIRTLKRLAEAGADGIPVAIGPVWHDAPIGQGAALALTSKGLTSLHRRPHAAPIEAGKPPPTIVYLVLTDAGAELLASRPAPADR